MNRRKDLNAVVHAVGYAAIYSAYLEEELNKLTQNMKMHFKMPKTPTLKLQTEALVKLFEKNLEFFTKNYTNEEAQNILSILKEICILATERNKVIHGVIYSKIDGICTRTDRKNNIKKTITSEEIYDLAEKLFNMQALIVRKCFVLFR